MQWWIIQKRYFLSKLWRRRGWFVFCGGLSVSSFFKLWVWIVRFVVPESSGWSTKRTSVFQLNRGRARMTEGEPGSCVKKHYTVSCFWSHWKLIRFTTTLILPIRSLSLLLLYWFRTVWVLFQIPEHIFKGYCCSAAKSADTILDRPPVGTKEDRSLRKYQL